MNSQEITYRTYAGNETAPYLKHLIMLRVRCLIDYPFLCMSSVDQERAEACQTTRLCVAYDKNRIIGLAIGLALKDYNVIQEGFNAAEQFTDTLKEKLPDYFLMSEIYLEKPYRHKGIAARLIKTLNSFVRFDKQYKHYCLLNLERDSNHPLQIENSYELSYLWKQCGYFPTGIRVTWNWPIRMIGVYGEYLEDYDNMLQLWSQDI